MHICFVTVICNVGLIIFKTNQGFCVMFFKFACNFCVCTGWCGSLKRAVLYFEEDGVPIFVCTGGMATKLQAAQIATLAGVRTVITKSSHPENILKIINGEIIGMSCKPPKTLPTNMADVRTVITKSTHPENIIKIINGEIMGMSCKPPNTLPKNMTNVRIVITKFTDPENILKIINGEIIGMSCKPPKILPTNMAGVPQNTKRYYRKNY